MATKNKDEKLRPFIYELKIQGIVDNQEEYKDNRMLRVMGIITKSNFLEEGVPIAPTMFFESASTLHIDDKIRVTLFSKNKNLIKTEQETELKVEGHKYEVWDDISGGWRCIYENFET